MNNKILFLDIDGTIRNFDGTIPASALKALKQAKAAGHQLVISTSRSLSEIEKRILDIGFDGIISGSGTYVLYKDQPVFYSYFPEETGYSLVHDLVSKGAVIELVTYRQCYMLKKQTKGFYGFLVHSAEKAAGVSDAHIIPRPQAIDSVQEVKNLEKLVYIGPQISKTILKKKYAGKIIVTDLSVHGGKYLGGEITPYGADKGNALRKICQCAGISREDAYAFGDSENDIAMFKAADTGIAMGNGSSSSKKAADMIAPDIKEDGLYRAFVSSGLIQH